MNEGAHVAVWASNNSMPVELHRLTGPSSGPIEPPTHLLTTDLDDRPTWDLDDVKIKLRLYQLCLSRGSAFDIYRCVNLDELRRLWPLLRLPDYVAGPWQRALDSTRPAMADTA